MFMQCRLKSFDLQFAAVSKIIVSTHEFAYLVGCRNFDARSLLDWLRSKELGRARSLFAGLLLVAALLAAGSMLACTARLGGDFGLHLDGNAGKQTANRAAAQQGTGQRNGREMQG